MRLNHNDELDAVLIRLLPRDISGVRMAAGQCLCVRLTVALVYCTQMAWDISCPHCSTLPPLMGGHIPFWLPVEAIHAVTIMSLNSERYRPTIICRCWPADRFVSFHRISVGPKGVKPLKSRRAKTYSRPLASKSRGAFALRALQLVPPLIKLTQSRNPGMQKRAGIAFPSPSYFCEVARAQ